MTPLWVTLAFIAGLATGALWREAFELLRRKDELMRMRRLLARAQHVNALTAALVVALLLCSLTGFGVILNDRGQARLVECFSRYNQLSGQAREERNAAVDTTASAELDYVRQDLRYQRGLLGSLEQGEGVARLQGVIRTRIEANQRYLDTLEAQRQVRATNAYPAPDFCKDYRP